MTEPHTDPDRTEAARTSPCLLAVLPVLISVVFFSSQQSSSGQDRTTPNGAERGSYGRHTGPVRTVAYSPDGQRIVSGSDDMTVKVWDAQTIKVGSAHTGESTLTLTGHTGSVATVAYSPDGQRILSGSRHGAGLKLWDAQTGQQISLRNQYTWPSESAAFSPDGKRIVNASGENTFAVWDVTAPEEKSWPQGEADAHQDSGRDLRELFRALAHGEPIAWALVIGLGAVLVLTPVVAICWRRFRKPVAAADPTQIVAAWQKQCRVRFLVLPVLVVPMILGTLVALALDNTAGYIVLVSCPIVSVFIGALMLILSTRCPACGAFTGGNWSATFCPKCGVALEETARPKPGQEASPAASEQGGDTDDQNKPA